MRRAFSQWHALDDAQWERLRGIFRPCSYDEKAFIALPGHEEHELLFVCEGLLRFFYVDKEGEETNKAFIAENSFAGPLAASAMGLPILYGIQALEPTALLAARHADFVALFDEDAAFDRLGRRLAELILMRKELRTRSFLQLDAKGRYLDFANQHPHLIHRIPQYHIASYLGIAEVSLSRLKRELA